MDYDELYSTSRPKRQSNAGDTSALPDTDDPRALAQAVTHDAINALRRIINDPDASPASVVAAAARLLDQGHDKPRQQLDIKQQIIVKQMPPVTIDGSPLEWNVGGAISGGDAPAPLTPPPTPSPPQLQQYVNEETNED